MSNNQISISPSLMTTAAGTFGVSWAGLMQGIAEPDPETRFALRSGYLASSETLPMFGGIAISEYVPGAANTPEISLGSQIARATSISSTVPITGFSVFDQAYGMLNSPNSPVPQIGAYGQVMYYRLGSGARIAVAMDPALVDLEGGLVTQNVSWDFNNQRLQPYDASTATYAISTMTWAATNGGQIAVVMSVPSLVGAVGDEINISGATNSGTGGNSVVNGDFVVTAFTDNEHFTIAAPAASGVIATIAGSPVINAGTGLLACKIDRVYGSNCMIINPVDAFGNYTWNRNGAAAVIQI